VQLEQIDFAPRTLVDEVAAMLTPRAQAKGLQAEFQVAADVPDYINGDPTRLRQVITNLLDNAIKFSHKGIVACVVKREGESALRFEISDQGVGITREQHARLFKAFSQADGSMTRKFGGTGLGLAIAKDLVQLAGGAIGVDSIAGDG